jgi:mannose-1-phosphate guanylyltransferase/mannose-6-phosphate isomerase
MELYDNGYVVTYDGLWSDVGSYDSIHSCLPKDKDGNVVDAKAEMIDTNNCYISSDGRLVATIGIKDTVIVDTKDALLVANIDRCQDVKTIVSRLGDINETRSHLKEYRPWGWYETVDGDDHSGHKVKRIHVYPNMKLSLQTHNHRAEHWVIICGTGKVTINDTQKVVTKNDYVFIPINAKHRVENIGTVPLEFIETQVGDYLGEDDIVRYDDDWGRHGRK